MRDCLSLCAFDCIISKYLKERVTREGWASTSLDVATVGHENKQSNRETARPIICKMVFTGS